MKYGYVRVSTTTQNIDRQMEEMHKYVYNCRKNVFLRSNSLIIIKNLLFFVSILLINP